MIYAMIHLNDLGSSTRYYSLLEKGVLTELMIMYLSKETALDPKLFDRITNRYTDEERAAFDFVIRDFFHLEGDGLYHCSSFDKLIEKSKSKSEKARKSVMARWDRNSAETKANNDRDTNVLLTNNQKPITNNQEVSKEKKEKKPLVFPADLPADVRDEWVAYKKKMCRSCTQRMVDDIVEQARLAGMSLADAMVYQMKKGWKGFEAEWVRSSSPTGSSKAFNPDPDYFDEEPF